MKGNNLKRGQYDGTPGEKKTQSDGKQHGGKQSYGGQNNRKWSETKWQDDVEEDGGKQVDARQGDEGEDYGKPNGGLLNLTPTHKIINSVPAELQPYALYYANANTCQKLVCSNSVAP